MSADAQEAYSLPANGETVTAATEKFLIPIYEILAVLQARDFLEDRYYRSQECGYNVGDLYTMNHWVNSGLATRFREKADANIIPIRRSCASYCESTCKVFERRRLLERKNGMREDDLEMCPMTREEMHHLLHDE